MEANDLPTKPMPVVQQKMMARTRNQVGYHCILQRSLRFDPNFYFPTRLRGGLRLTLLFYAHGDRPRMNLYMYAPDTVHNYILLRVYPTQSTKYNSIHFDGIKPWPSNWGYVLGRSKIEKGMYFVIQMEPTWSQTWNWEVRCIVNDICNDTTPGAKEYDRLWTDPYYQGEMLLMEYHVTQIWQSKTSIIYSREMILPVKYGMVSLHPGSVCTITAKTANIDVCGPRVEIALLPRGGNRETSRLERRRIHSLGDAQPDTHVTITLMASAGYVKVLPSFSDKIVLFSPQEDTAGYAFHFFCNIDIINAVLDCGAWYYARWY
ncbi:uncharacterized protein LOC135400020 [Ornithodoros turicata]|uniref:uncharacterized protein LOC135400020 n=1 Tax=Ornithodoros turicata TaxID=34597 RepID=UPI00313A34C2